MKWFNPLLKKKLAAVGLTLLHRIEPKNMKFCGVE
jgi:hypothetical protein